MNFSYQSIECQTERPQMNCESDIGRIGYFILDLDRFNLDQNNKLLLIMRKWYWSLNQLLQEELGRVELTSDQFSKISPKSNPIKSDLSDEQMVINSLPVEILWKTIKMLLCPPITGILIKT